MLDGFNPHPSRRTGATRTVHAGTREPSRFNPHPSRRTGATSAPTHAATVAAVSILTRPEGRVQLRAEAMLMQPRIVSILTRPEGRVQLHPLEQAQLDAQIVSILTRPEGRVQLSADGTKVLDASGFNPHPSRRTGATRDYRPLRERR